MSQTAIVIPARLASTRLPNKPLADICGKPMIQLVYEQACLANIGDVIVATCSTEIINLIESIGGIAVLTDPELPSGTDRVAAAINHLGKHYDYVINLQGDLPLVDPEHLKQIHQELLAHNTLTTLCAPMEPDDINNPNAVKIVMHFDNPTHGKALYFSRAAVPHGASIYYHHIGIYGYPKLVLDQFIALPPSPLEIIEKLEQLRALEANITIRVCLVRDIPLSVDTKEDLDLVIDKILNSYPSN